MSTKPRSGRNVAARTTDPPAPTELRVIRATPSAATLRWRAPGGKFDWFRIEWTRDRVQFVPVDEVHRTPRRRVYTYTDRLPASGKSWYRIRACRHAERRPQISTPTRLVKVTIEGPAAGDVT